MSFKKFSAAQNTPSNDMPENKTKTASTVAAPAGKPVKKQDENAPAQKP